MDPEFIDTFLSSSYKHTKKKLMRKEKKFNSEKSVEFLTKHKNKTKQPVHMQRTMGNMVVVSGWL